MPIDEQEIERERLKETMFVRKEMLEKVRKYNKWVDEEREKAEQWRPSEPRVGKRVPFKHSDIYYMHNDKDLERYPELARMDEEAEAEEEVEEQFSKYYKPSK